MGSLDPNDIIGRYQSQRQEAESAAIRLQREMQVRAAVYEAFGSVSNFAKDRLLTRLGHEPTEAEFYNAWAGEFLEIRKVLNRAGLVDRLKQLEAGSNPARDCAILLATLACESGRFDEITPLLQRVVAVPEMWIESSVQLRRLPDELLGVVRPPAPAGWEGSPPEEPIDSLEDLRAWIRHQLQIVRQSMQASGGVENPGQSVRNAYRILERLNVAGSPAVPQQEVKSGLDEEAALMRLDAWARDTLAKHAWSDRTRLFVEDLFPEVRKVGPEAVTDMLNKYGRLEYEEEAIQKTFEKALHVEGHKKDWGGEENDLYTANCLFEGNRVPAAFLLKGKGLQATQLHIAGCGHNGDQIVRLFKSPAEVFVIQFVGLVSENLIADVKDKVLARRSRGERAWYCIIDGQDTARILRAYGMARN